MADQNFPLTLTLKAIDQASGVFKQLGDKIAKLTEPAKKVKEAFGDFRKELAITGVELFEVFEAGKRVFEFFKSGVEAGAELKHAAERAGFMVDAYAQLRFAAEKAGVKQDEFAAATDQLNKRLGEAKAGGGPLLELLDKVAPRLAQQIKHAKDAGEAFVLLNTAFQKEHDPAKKAALQNAAFGRSTKEMAALLSQSSDELIEQGDRYLKLAGSQEDFANKSKKAEEAFVDVDAALQGLRKAALTPLLPALTKLSTALADVLAGNQDKLKKWAEDTGKAIETWVNGGGLDRLVKGIENLAASTALAIDKIGGFKTVLEGVALIMAGPLIGSVVSLGSALWGIGKALNSLAFAPVIALASDFFLGLQAGYPILQAFKLALVANPAGAFVLALTSLSLAALEIYKNWTPIKEMFADIWDKWQKIATTGKGWGKLWHAVTGEYDAEPAFKGLPESSKRGALNDLRPGAAGGESYLKVEFENMPKGTRVTQDPQSTADVDLLMGWSMVLQ